MYWGSQISEHMSHTPEGFLVCHDAPLCRTATKTPQRYRGTELGLHTDKLVDVFRDSKEVLTKSFLASLNGKPITDNHPKEFLTSENARWLTLGHVQNVRIGPKLSDGETCVVGDLVITDEDLIRKIKDGVRELSVGYKCRYRDNRDGSFSQTNLEANHIAVVASGRAGKDIRILDSQDEDEEDGEDMKKKLNAELKQMIKEVVREVISEWPAGAEAQPVSDHNVIETFSSTFTAQEHPFMNVLRKLRPGIEASGTEEEKQHYNYLVRYFKSVGNHLVRVGDVAPPVQKPSERETNDAFDDAVQRARAATFGAEPERFTFTERTTDSISRSDDEEWGIQMNEYGRKMRDQQRPQK